MKILKKLILITCLLVLSSCQKQKTSEITFYKSHEKTRQNVPFSDAVQVGNLFFLTGQIGKNHSTGKLVEGGIEAETTQALKNINTVLTYHKLSLQNVVKCTVILSDINDFSKMNTIYREFFKDNLPARTTFAANLVANAKIEIEVIAAKE